MTSPPRSESLETLSGLDAPNAQPLAEQRFKGGGRAANVKQHALYSMFSTRSLSLHVFTQDDVWKPVLHNVSATIVPSRLTALMGPSGAGKSTLMDTISNRLPTGTPVRVTGEVLVQGSPINLAKEGPIGEYVRQNDLFLPCMTAHEVLHFYATLKLCSRSHSTTEVAQRIQETLTMTGLTGSAHTACGGVMPGGVEIKGLSGGEKRRLSIACSLLAMPAVMWLDEPTSGLDSFNALMVMSSLQTLTAAGRTIVATIHQPSADVWALLDDVVMLAKGHLVYEGRCSHVLPWFSDTLGYRCNGVDRHPGEYALALVTTGFDKPARLFGDLARIQYTADLEGLALQLDAQWMRPRRNWRRALALALVAVARRKVAGALMCEPTKKGQPGRSGRRQGRQGRVSTMQQIRALSTRQLANYTRNPGNALARTAVGLLLGAVVGAAYWKLSLWTDVLGVLWFTISVLCLIPFCSIALFTSDRRYFLVETQDGLYNAFAFWFTWAAAETVLNTATALCFGIPMHFMSDLSSGHVLFGLQSVFVVFYLVAAQMLVAVSVVVGNQDVTFGIGAGVVAISQLFGGYLIHVDNLLAPLQWVSWLSYLRYGFQAALRMELETSTYNQHHFAQQMLTDERHQQWLQTLLVLIPQNLEGKEIIAAYDYFPYGAWYNLACLGIFLLVFHYITYSTLVTTHGCYKPRNVIVKTKRLMSACTPACFPVSSNPTLLPISPGTPPPYLAASAYDIEGAMPVARPPAVRRTTTVAW